MQNNKEQYNIKPDSIFDINKILMLLKSNWYLFLISFPLCLGGAYFYHKYSSNIYRSTITLMIKSDERKTISGAEIIEGFGLSPEMRSIENQTIIIKSKNVVRRAIDNLSLGIEIYSDGIFNDIDLYKKNPFEIIVDSGKPQLLNRKIYITPLENDLVNIKIQSENTSLYNFNEEKQVGYISSEIEFDKNFKWGEQIKSPFCNFHLKKKSILNPEVSYYAIFRSKDYLISKYRRGISISPLSENSTILYVSITGFNTQKLNDFLNSLGSAYIAHSLERKNEIAKRTINFIDKQLKLIGDTLDVIKSKLNSYKTGTIYGSPSELATKVAENYYQAQQSLSSLSMQEDYYNKLVNILNNNPSSKDYLMPVFSNNNHSILNSMITDLIELQNTKEILISESNSENPILIETNKKIILLQEDLKNAINKLLANIRINKRQINNNMKEMSLEMSKLTDDEKQYLEIEREYKLKDAIFNFLLQKQSETEITKASNTPDNEIIDNATITGIVSPKKAQNNKKAMALALIIPISIIFLREYLNNTIRTKEDLISIVGSNLTINYIPRSSAVNEKTLLSDPQSSVAESFRAMRTKLKFIRHKEKSQTILFTSTESGEGKTFCAVNLAISFAISGVKTVLVGYDLRKPRINEALEVLNKSGVTDYLIGTCSYKDIMSDIGINNLTLISSGTIPPNPSELIASDKTQELIYNLQNDFQVIIIDTPPVGLVSDAQNLIEYVDSVFYIVRAEKTVKNHLRHSLVNFYNEDIKSLNIVMNDIPNKSKSYGYYSNTYYHNENN